MKPSEIGLECLHVGDCDFGKIDGYLINVVSGEEHGREDFE